MGVWEDVQAVFTVLRVTNLFAADAELGASMLRFILINVVHATGITFKAWVGSRAYVAAIEACKAAEPDNYNFDAADEAFRTRDLFAAIGDNEIKIVSEVQLHLSNYLVARRKTHLWFKVERVDDWSNLVADCRKYSGYTG